VPKSVPHAAAITPGLAWHHVLGARTQPMSGLTDPLDTAFDGIPSPFVLFERSTVHTLEIARDALSILYHVVEAVRGVVPRRQ
jgi:hypothetical protein